LIQTNHLFEVRSEVGAAKYNTLVVSQKENNHRVG